MPNSKILIGVDLDGVIAKENWPALSMLRYLYVQDPTLKNYRAIMDYYNNLEPNEDIIKDMIRFKSLFNYKIFTARRNDVKDHIKVLTKHWVERVGLDGVVSDVVHTRYKWKLPELLWNGCDVMIDNDLPTMKYYVGLNCYGYHKDANNTIPKGYNDCRHPFFHSSEVLFDAIYDDFRGRFV